MQCFYEHVFVQGSWEEIWLGLDVASTFSGHPSFFYVQEMGVVCLFQCMDDLFSMGVKENKREMVSWIRNIIMMSAVF